MEDYGNVLIHPPYTWETITKIFVDDVILSNSQLDKLDWHEYDIQKEDYYNDNRYMTLNELSEQLYRNTHVRMITVVVDSPLHGIIYQIGNYKEMEWYKKGETIGFA